MATSGSKDFSITRTKIVKAALRKCGVLDSQDELDASDEQDAVFALNLLVKEWAKFGLDIWLRKEFTLFLSGKQVYSIGPGGDEATTDSVIAAKLTATGSATSIVFATSAAAGMAVNDKLVIKLDDGTTHSTTVTAIQVSGSGYQITFQDVMTGTASSGNSVFAYQNSLVDKPIELIHAMRRLGDQDVPVNSIGESEYQRLNLKSQEGATTNIWFKPMRTNTEIRVWPIGDARYERLIVNAVFYADDMDSVSDEPEFPIEWGNALIFHLAHDLAPEYGLSRTERADLFTIGQRKLDEQLDWNVEDASVRFTIDQSGHG